MRRLVCVTLCRLANVQLHCFIALGERKEAPSPALCTFGAVPEGSACVSSSSATCGLLDSVRVMEVEVDKKIQEDIEQLGQVKPVGDAMPSDLHHSALSSRHSEAVHLG